MIFNKNSLSFGDDILPKFTYLVLSRGRKFFFILAFLKLNQSDFTTASSEPWITTPFSFHLCPFNSFQCAQQMTTKMFLVECARHENSLITTHNNSTHTQQQHTQQHTQVCNLRWGSCFACRKDRCSAIFAVKFATIFRFKLLFTFLQPLVADSVWPGWQILFNRLCKIFH